MHFKARGLKSRLEHFQVNFVLSIVNVYEIVKPALAVPVMAPARSNPDVVDEKTINKRSPAATGTGGKFADVPKTVVPTARTPVTAGARSTDTPVGVKVLLPAGARKI